jgi:hypothetical protein
VLLDALKSGALENWSYTKKGKNLSADDKVECFVAESVLRFCFAVAREGGFGAELDAQK